MTFQSGQTQDFFHMYYSNMTQATEETVVGGGIDQVLSGINSDIYKLSLNSLDFTISAQQTTEATLIRALTSSVKKTSVSISLETSEPCYLYYMVALVHTEIPLYNIVKAGGPWNETSTQSQFGVAYVYASNSSILFTTAVLISNLLPEIKYSMYVYLENRGGVHSNVAYNHTFSTKDRDNAADVSIRLKQSYVSEYDKMEIVEAIALILSLDIKYVQAQTYTFSASSGATLRRLRILMARKVFKAVKSKKRLRRIERLQVGGTGLETFQSVAVTGTAVLSETSILYGINLLPTLQEIYPSPKTIGGYLNDKKSLQSARILNFDESYVIPSTEFNYYQPSFVTPPYISGYTYEQATITTRFNNYGWLFACAVKTSNNFTNSTTPYQIRNGLDHKNVAVPKGFVEIQQSYVYFNLIIDGLEAATNYTVFVIGGNSHPGEADLMPYEQVMQQELMTEDAPAIQSLDLKAFWQLVLPIITFTILMVILL